MSVKDLGDPFVRRHTAPVRPGTSRRKPDIPPPSLVASNTELLPLQEFFAKDVDSSPRKVVQRVLPGRPVIDCSDELLKGYENQLIIIDTKPRQEPIAAASPYPPKSFYPTRIGRKTNPYSVKIVNSKPLSLVELRPNCNQLNLGDFETMKMTKSTPKCKALPTPIDGNLQGPENSIFQEKEKKEAVQLKKYGKLLKDIKKPEGPLKMSVTTKSAETHSLTGHKQQVNNTQGRYYVMSQAENGDFTAYPVNDWYQFEPSLKYKPLTSEEADEEYERRNKRLNYFSVMVKKRLQGMSDEDIQNQDQECKTTKTMVEGDSDPWIDSDESECSEGNHLEDNGKLVKPKKSSKKKSVKHQRKYKVGVGEEDEDDNDFNVDDAGGTPYETCDESLSGSESEGEKKTYQRGVDEEDGLKDLLKWDSDSSSDEGQEVKKESLDKPSVDKKIPGTSKKNQGLKKRTQEKVNKKKFEIKKSLAFKDQIKDKENANLVKANAVEIKVDPPSSKSLVFKIGANAGAWNIKRVADRPMSQSPPAKRARTEVENTSDAAGLSRAENAGVTEEAVKRYLLRKPITVTDLCKKFRSKCAQLSKTDLSGAITHHLQALNPSKQMLNSKTLWYIPAAADKNSLYLSMIENKSGSLSPS